jgi:hypothetical protein
MDEYSDAQAEANAIAEDGGSAEEVAAAYAAATAGEDGE